MEALDRPDPEEIAAVETTLYNRMVKNAFFGFMKSALIGFAIGLAVGMIASATGLLPAATMFDAALKGAMWLGGVAGSFGAVAGIQSTRDTRRWFKRHENPELNSPEETREQAMAVSPEIETCCDKDHFRKMVDDKANAKSTPLRTQ